MKYYIFYRTHTGTLIMTRPIDSRVEAITIGDHYRRIGRDVLGVASESQIANMRPLQKQPKSDLAGASQ